MKTEYPAMMYALSHNNIQYCFELEGYETALWENDMSGDYILPYPKASRLDGVDFDYAELETLTSTPVAHGYHDGIEAGNHVQ